MGGSQVRKEKKEISVYFANWNLDRLPQSRRGRLQEFRGIDIDWEYPGCSTAGERLPDLSDPDHDEGCPIWGTAKEDSNYYKWFLTYEDHWTLQKKLYYIHDAGVGGIIIWEVDQDTQDYAFMNQIADNLIR